MCRLSPHRENLPRILLCHTTCFGTQGALLPWVNGRLNGTAPDRTPVVAPQNRWCPGVEQTNTAQRQVNNVAGNVEIHDLIANQPVLWPTARPPWQTIVYSTTAVRDKSGQPWHRFRDLTGSRHKAVTPAGSWPLLAKTSLRPRIGYSEV
jgi:hypothetical protein